ncbi:DUF3017 domain-containing protein [Streptomyces sp. NPDC091376]|uniref:DUF3017 domain-containing protein n=1 Tax=Streptomyces sp. NPDC091376 TaxID=3365994 RepID=UPI00381FFC88
MNTSDNDTPLDGPRPAQRPDAAAPSAGGAGRTTPPARARANGSAGHSEGDDPARVNGHAGDAADDAPAAVGPGAAGRSRRPPTVTRDTARPEGGGRAAPGDASAPARQWPLLTVLGLTGLGLLIVAADPFDQAFRIGTILVGVALLTGAVLRRVLPSVGMLAVRSRFTDMVTYGLFGTVIVLLALMVQPRPWLEIPFLEDAVRFTVR